ncbi:hypothetical protein FIBSPDRAFT_765177 [Athelia psychrophila]|uniref:Alpha-ketoglutarate-dependent dioxygenase AlkB-like domain-containing protein n=1 Tax=Athelia psychrophila TaxID=1759441 RepID=A0A167WCU1_9AGAM|nr:hypothetical protein FIBSPDRAFT_765177 [Fibularhizoctonia sp. CBS 109695]
MAEEEAPANQNNEVDSRPILDKMPPIWSTSRQEVCESLDWFRSYHSGVYSSNNIVKGYLLGGFPSIRDIFAHDGRIIISHGGGGHESLHSKDGRLVPQAATDQLDKDKSVRALLNNHSQNRPVVLLVDDRFKLFPYNLTAKGCAYAVLGFFCITNVWAEYHPLPNASGGAVRYKFCFQWCQSQGDPWWLKSTTKASGSSGETMTSPPATVNVAGAENSFRKRNSGTLVKCEQCKIQTPQVYQQGWMCLSAKCEAFWKMTDGSCPPLQLDYAPSFLELAPPDGFPQSLPPICPATPQESGSDEITTSFAFTKGWHCTRCGRLSSRYVWAFWECANCHVRDTFMGKALFALTVFLSTKYRQQVEVVTRKNSGIIKSHSATYDVQGCRGEYVKYILPYSRGVIHLIRGNVRANREADAIFEQYQREAGTAEKLVFRRFPLRAVSRGPLLTNYFSQNSGEPYQYVGGTDNTVPFSDTAEAVNNALELIRTRAEAALNRRPDFNEILSAAYMEQQKMAFHSDSERGLGPVVASLSLGSAAHMHFRPHVKLEEGRENALSLVLRHGDVVVMEGAEVQECYEHTVIPFNFRIAATARWIGGDNASTFR